MSVISSHVFFYLKKPTECHALSLEEWAKLILVLRETKLLASFGFRAEHQGCFSSFPKYAQKHIKSAMVYADRQKQQIKYEAIKLEETFGAQSIPFCLMKGAAYVVKNERCSEGRLVSDIDVLVRKEDLIASERALKLAMWQTKKLDDYDEKYYREWAHELPPFFHPLRGTVLDVHHNLFMAISDKAPNIDEFLEHSEKVSENGSVFNSPEMIMHSCIHLFANEDMCSASRDLFDLFLLTNELDEKQWLRLIELANITGFTLELYCLLTCLVKYFDVELVGAAFYFVSECKHKNRYRFWSVVYARAVLPIHPLVTKPADDVARFVVFCRGHLLKMPLSLLIKHLAVKSYVGLYKGIAGKFSMDS
ncbi:nucleotidyltransferase family protein [Aestuariibacter salexigens]|uniref:nucleotidyltransferase family protein n=1 Tax=Aestuariibacter salexigens TaxID=226010 RepID=UPI000403E0AE|nr:nucleotidyltransferase family protein [Aestuariibacter salexigens]